MGDCNFIHLDKIEPNPFLTYEKHNISFFRSAKLLRTNCHLARISETGICTKYLYKVEFDGSFQEMTSVHANPIRYLCLRRKYWCRLQCGACSFICENDLLDVVIQIISLEHPL